MLKFLGFIVLLNLIISDTGVNSYDHDCKYLQEDYETLYNTSLGLYTDCIKETDYYMNLYENEMQVTDMFMGKLQECEYAVTNLSSSVNYTALVMSKRENIELEAALLTLQKKINKYQENHDLELSLITDYKENILNLHGNVTRLTKEIYDIDSELNKCHGNLEVQRKTEKKIFGNLNSCLEREELMQEQKDKYVLRLSTCRKNNRKFKSKLTE